MKILDVRLLASLVKNSKVLHHLIEQSDDYSLVFNAMENESSDDRLLSRLMKINQTMPVLQKIALHPRTSEESLRELSQISPILKKGVALNPETPERLFREIIEGESNLLYQEFHGADHLLEYYLYEDNLLIDLSNPRFAEMYRGLDGLHADAHAELAKNPTTPPEVLEELYELRSLKDDEIYSESISTGLAENESTPISILQRLIRTPFRTTKFALSKNPEIPEIEGAVETLMADEDPLVRLGVGLNPSTPTAVIEELEENKILEKLRGVDTSFLLPLDDLKNYRVTEGEAGSYREFSRFFEDFNLLPRTLIAYTASSTSTSIKELEEIKRLANERSDERKILPYIALNPKTDDKILRDIYEEHGEDEEVQIGLVLNSNTPTQILFDLHKGGEWELKTLISENPNYDFDKYVTEFGEVDE